MKAELELETAFLVTRSSASVEGHAKGSEKVKEPPLSPSVGRVVVMSQRRFHRRKNVSREDWKKASSVTGNWGGGKGWGRVGRAEGWGALECGEAQEAGEVGQASAGRPRTWVPAGGPGDGSRLLVCGLLWSWRVATMGSGFWQLPGSVVPACPCVQFLLV